MPWRRIFLKEKYKPLFRTYNSLATNLIPTGMTKYSKHYLPYRLILEGNEESETIR